MANILRPGFHPIAMSDHPRAPVRMRVADDYDGDLGGSNKDVCVGDPVRLANSGTVALAAAAETVWGVIVGIEPHYSTADGFMKYSNTLPNQTSYDTNLERESRVLVMPVQGGQRFRVQTDEVSASYNTYSEMRAFIGENCDHIYVASQMPAGHCLLDISTHATTAEGWQIVDIPDPDFQDFSSAYVTLTVVINEGQIAPFSTTGV
jgi:hypothetical protein